MKNTTLNNIDDWHNLLQAAENGNADAQLEVAIQYGSGIVINGAATAESDEKLEYEWAKRAWKNGCAEAGEVYAFHLSNGIYCPKDTALAIKLYRKAVKAGSGSAAHNLGIEYRDMGKYKKAFALYKKADELGGDISVGLCYYYGVGVARDKLKAFYFFKNLLKRNICLSSYDSNEANYLIGNMYLEGEVVKRSVSKARHYLLLANEDDDHTSASELLAIIGRYDRPK